MHDGDVLDGAVGRGGEDRGWVWECVWGCRGAAGAGVGAGVQHRHRQRPGRVVHHHGVGGQ